MVQYIIRVSEFTKTGYSSSITIYNIFMWNKVFEISKHQKYSNSLDVASDMKIQLYTIKTKLDYMKDQNATIPNL